MTYCATTTSNAPSCKTEVLRIHHGEAIDIGQPVLGDTVLGLAQHRRGEIDTGEAVGPGIFRQRQPGADADLEDPAADALGCRDRSLAAAIEHRPNTRS